ncbi:MAG: hypothetical protein IPM34_05615 [Saprospiraceae bacterium]|nr:hypothetical protein [Saprospiraceae bacterium]
MKLRASLSLSYLFFTFFPIFLTEVRAQGFCNLDTNPPVISNCPQDFTINIGNFNCTVGVGFPQPSQLADDDCGLVNGFGAASFFTYHNEVNAGFGDDGQFIQHGLDSVTIVGTTNGNAGVNNRFNVCFYASCNGTMSFNWRARMNNGDGFAGDRVRLMIDHQGHGVAINTVFTTGNGSTANGAVIAQQVLAGDRVCFEVQSDNQGGVDSLTLYDLVFVPIAIPVHQTKGPKNGELFIPGTHLIEFTAVDCAGNSSVCQYNITVQQEPGKDLFDYCPSNTTVTLDYPTDCDTIVNWLTPITSDPCNMIVGFNREMDPRIIGPILEEFAAPGMGDGIIGSDGIMWLDSDEDSLMLVGINNGTPGNDRDDTSSIKACVQPICAGLVEFDWSASIEAIIGGFRSDEAGIIFNGKDSILSVPPSGYYASGSVSLQLDGINPLCFYVRSTNMNYEDTLIISNFKFTHQDPILTQISGVDINTPIGPGIYDFEFEAEDCYGNLDTCAFQVTVIGSGPMPCKNINLSLDENCLATVTPDMLVTGVCTGTMVIELSHYGNPVDNPLTQDWLWKHITAKVTDTLTGNSCWSDIVVEDKLAPVIVCRADTVDCNLVEKEFPLQYDGFDCSSYTVTTVNETFEHFNCDSNFLKAIYRDIQIKDERGEVDYCTDTIYVKRIKAEDVVLPTLDFFNFTCETKFLKDENGNPSPLVTRVPYIVQSDGTKENIWPLNELLDCHLFISYEDTDLGEINCVRKIMRTWTVREWWCHTEITRQSNQLIIIKDPNGPEITHMPYGFTATTGPRSCYARVLLPPIEAEDACHNDLRIDIAYPGGILIDQNGGWVDLPAGKDTIWYRVYDACYNLTEVYIIIDVLDETEPVAVCDRNTVVAINRLGQTWAPAEVFDDGSFDECAVHHFEVRRMQDDYCNTRGEDDWGPEVGFCCEDVGNTVMVGLKVIDHSGNEAICMVNVEVQDKEAPQISCPPNITVDCRFDIDYNNLEVFGKVVTDSSVREKIIIDPIYHPVIDGHPLDGYAYDNCPPTILERLYLGPELNQCGIGYFDRSFTAVDQQGNRSIECLQRITVINHYVFDANDIDWPDDYETSDICDPNQLIPERLVYPYDKPVTSDDECSLIGLSYHDHVLTPTQVGDPCFKIIRVWKVIDWCQRDINNNVIIWQDTQYIKVFNYVDPVIKRVTADTTICSYDVNCRPIPVSFSIEANDDCTDSTELLYICKIDYHSDGSIDFIQSRIGGDDVSGTWPLGTHLVKWEVEDRCGNTAKASFTLELLNCKPPVAYCLNGLSTNLVPMDTTGDGIPDVAMDTVWAADFNAGSYHNCGYQIWLSFSADTNDTYRVYDCDDRGLQEVEMWVTDENGNTSFCRTFIDIQDNSSFCPPTFQNSKVEGEIMTEVQDRVENVRVELLNSGRNELLTNVQGSYLFDQIPTNQNYELTPKKTDGWLNGVTTADIVKIQRHILGLEPFATGYKMIAADVNRSGEITAKDVSELRRLILGITSEIPGNTSWRFVHTLHSFNDVSNALKQPIPESYQISNLNGDMKLDFYAVKVGDLTGNAITKGFGGLANRSGSVLELEMDAVELQKGEIAKIPLRIINGNQYQGIQFTLEWLTQKMEVISVEGNSRKNIGDDHYSMHHVGQGKISMSWNGPMEEQMELITLEVKAKDVCRLSEIFRVGSSITPAISVTNDGSEGQVVMQFRGSAHEGFVVIPNEPNPWNEETQIGMILPSQGMVKLTVYDVNGKIHFIDQMELNKGYHEYRLGRQQINQAGVYYYQLDFKDASHTGKMVIME